ncbi:MAG: ABC transporter substrate-binding protein [Thermoguttaceae bacterium]|jgi:iron complex transport system substrate-binding protein
MNRKRQIVLISAVAVALSIGGVWIAARRLPTPPVQGQAMRFVTDLSGRRVRIPLRPTRVLSLCTSATDTIVALGAGDRLLAIDEFSRVVPGTERLAIAGKGSAISREKVAALQVDLAFLWWYQADAAAMLEDLSIPVVLVRSVRAAELPATVRLIGNCTDCGPAAERLAAELETFLARAERPPTLAAKRVFLELYGPLKTVGRDTYTNDLLELAGARNVAADAKGTLLFSAERLVQADPDVILVVGAASDRAALVSRPGMTELRAVREGRVFALDRYWLVAGPQMPQSVERIRRTISGSPSP